MAAALSERPGERRNGLRLVARRGASESFGGYEIDPEGVRRKERPQGAKVDRLPEHEVQALRAVFGGLESEMGLCSSMGAQIASLAAAPKAKCGHIERVLTEWQESDGVQRKALTPGAPCKRQRKLRKSKKASKTAELIAILIGQDGTRSLEAIPGRSEKEQSDQQDEPESQNVLTLEPKSAESLLESKRPEEASAFSTADEAPRRAPFLRCGACKRLATCPECGECRHCGSRAWQTMIVHGTSHAPFNPNAVGALEERAWGGAMAVYRSTRDALLALVERGKTEHVVVLSKMYSGEASTEHSRRWPKLGDVVPIATMTEAVLSRAKEMTKRLQRESRAQSFQVSAFAALESAMSADNAAASVQEIRRQAERMLERASAAYAKEKVAATKQRKDTRKRSVALAPWKRKLEGEDVDD